MNLASNITARPKDAWFHSGVPGGLCVQVLVSETGIGMDEDVRVRAFEPFFTTKAPGRGAGLGLSTCHGVVKQSGERLLLESDLGKGTVVRILPHCARRSAATEQAEAAKRRNQVPIGNGETILIVEDDSPGQKIYCTMLRRLNYTAISASNGNGALRIAENRSEIRLVVTELVMPLVGGTDLAQRLRHVLPDAKIVMMFGDSAEPLETSGAWRDTTFLPKPLSRDTLASTLREFPDAAAAA